ncbi:MAG: hypothetical protein LBI78_07465 [Campylobacteraceae bacterium]|jgi:DNA-binding ferritin-like protein|nr:hypothetical protein [Campylobacteraceae bacterium]
MLENRPNLQTILVEGDKTTIQSTAKEKILKHIEDTDQALEEIEKAIVSYKNIADDKTKDFLERIKERIQKLRLPKLQ